MGKQAYGSDYDTRWGKSYDSVNAKSYDDEQYARKIWADDDQWAEDYDRYSTQDADSYGKAAKTTVTPVTVHSGYGHGGHGSNAGYGAHGNNGYGQWLTNNPLHYRVY